MINLLLGDVALFNRAEQTKRNEVTRARGVSDIAGAQKRGGGKKAAHAAEVFSTLRDDVGPGHGVGMGIGRTQGDVLPRGIEMQIVPSDVFVHHGTRGRMGGHVVTKPLAHDPDFSAVSQCLPIVGS